MPENSSIHSLWNPRTQFFLNSHAQDSLYLLMFCVQLFPLLSCCILMALLPDLYPSLCPASTEISTPALCLYLVLYFIYLHILFFLLSLCNHFLVLLSFLVSELLSFNFWNLIQWLSVLLSPFICGSQLSYLCLAGTDFFPTSPSRHRYLFSSPLPPIMPHTHWALCHILFFVVPRI